MRHTRADLHPQITHGEMCSDATRLRRTICRLCRQNLNARASGSALARADHCRGRREKDEEERAIFVRQRASWLARQRRRELLVCLRNDKPRVRVYGWETISLSFWIHRLIARRQSLGRCPVYHIGLAYCAPLLPVFSLARAA